MSSSPSFEIADGDLLVLLGDPASRYAYVNDAYLRAFGYEWAELKGTPTAKVLSRGTPMQLLKAMTLSVRRREPWTGLIECNRKSGERFWLRLNISPLFAADGRFAGSLMVHSKPSREEIERAAPLYERLLSAGGQGLMLGGMRLYRDNRVGRLIESVRHPGLRTRIGLALSAAAGFALLGPWAAGWSMASWAVYAGLVGVLAGIAAYLARSVVTPLRRAVQQANRIAAGDLAIGAQTSRTDEIGGLVRALTQMGLNTRAAVLDVRNGITALRGTTEGIASGTDNLSARTELQASSLQQTAATMEEINATVKNSEHSARQANAMALQASQAAESGGKAVDEVIATMNEIARSSKQIADIIGVIDGIAFQTNILALNAAVEAARAGAQGRGFAVVAGEVRNLAQRSAQSAKEIRALISQSVSTIDDGARLVQGAGHTIQGVVDHVRSVTELVAHIAAATVEQASGVGQVNEAIVQLDRVTQQNAALVQESSASAGGLREQTGRLSDAIGIFKLSADENAAMLNAMNRDELAASQRAAAQKAGLKR